MRLPLSFDRFAVAPLPSASRDKQWWEMTMDLQEISDRLEIQNLMVAYCYAIDNRDWDALDDVFTTEAIIDYTEMVGIKGNLKEIKAFLAESMQQISNSQHIISTTQLTVAGDRAQGRTSCNHQKKNERNNVGTGTSET